LLTLSASMAETLFNIHELFLRKMHARYQLQPVALKHPFPERPARALGILKIDGAVFESEKFFRIMAMTTRFLVSSRCTRSIFLGPRVKLHLPIFSSETILMGTRRAFLVDIHTTVRQERWQSLQIEEKMQAIRNRYPDLCRHPLTLQGKINDIMSAAHVYVRILPEQDAAAISLFNDYLDLYLDLVDAHPTGTDNNNRLAAEDFDHYYKTVIIHDPAVKLYSMLFGKNGGLERVNDLFFAR